MNKLVTTILAGVLCTTAACASRDQTPAESTASTAELENTYWKVMTIGGAPVVVKENQREPHMVFHSEGNRLAAFAGCNQMSGTYEVDGAKLKLSRMATTMMACEDGMEQEQALHEALGNVATWVIRGESLDLLDADGKPVATFESRYLR